MNNRKYNSKDEKWAAIIRAVFRRENTGLPTSIYAVAKYIGYTPNGSFGDDVWKLVDAGYLDARPVSRGNRFAWQLTVTAKAINARGLWQ